MRSVFSWLLLAWLGFGLSTSVLAQSGYGPDELDQLVAPVALYPDPLLSTVISAATQPDQVVAAAQAGSPSTSWDSSVQALCSYPEVLGMMANNKEWTSAVGWASANQVTELMDAVQRFRYKARSAGNLQSDDKILVIEEGAVIRIEPANPEVIYVPVEVNQDSSSSNFGTVLGYSAGIALNVLLWQNVFSWNNGCWYHPARGWRPTAGYYRPYGANGAFARATPYSPRTNVNRPVNINNINTGNIRVNTGNRNTQVNRNTQINRNTQVNRSQVAPSQRPSISQPSWGSQPSLERRPTFDAPSTARPAISDYSRAGDTVRASNRGASSRRTGSFSSGSRGGGGGRRR